MKKYFYKIATDQITGFPTACLKAFLLFLSFVYGLAVKGLLLFYRKGFLKVYRLPRKVISVGNITLGGTGKTPLVEFIARSLSEKGIRPVILIRGYMSGGRKPASLEGPISDEAVYLRKALGDVPVLVGADRVKSARSLAPGYPVDVFILDDGFQQWGLARDLEIVAINTANPFGNRFLLPRGILREPLSSLARSDVFVLTKTDQGGENIRDIREELSQRNPRALIVEARHCPRDFLNLRTMERVGLSGLGGQDIGSFCSIGDPHSFELSLNSVGVKVKRNFVFLDHHVYQAQDIRLMNEFCRANGIKFLVTTEKDSAKLGSWLDSFESDVCLLALRVTLEMASGKKEFLDRAFDLFRS
ncbi:MAG: tetraacyldisaccharide 4'-kinase [Candidatus Omnitrophota bacterium]